MALLDGLRRQVDPDLSGGGQPEGDRLAVSLGGDGARPWRHLGDRQLSARPHVVPPQVLEQLAVGLGLLRNFKQARGIEQLENAAELDPGYVPVRQALIREMLLDPGFHQVDFTRLKSDAINFLKVSLRAANDEELAKEHLYNVIYSGHPYGHHNLGSLGALEKLTLGDVREFYRRSGIAAKLDEYVKAYRGESDGVLRVSAREMVSELWIAVGEAVPGWGPAKRNAPKPPEQSDEAKN